MNEGILIGESQSLSFFPDILDVALLVAAVISTLISLLIPCLFYLKKQCQEHPTVLIANISLLQSIANFNIVLMAIDIFKYEDSLNIKSIFHLLTFNFVHLPSTDQNTDFCVYNYCIYMLVQLLSISFHICYSIDLLITMKFPFFPGKKRRKYYYAFSVLLPIITLANSFHQAENICANQLTTQSIYKIPFWFLITLLLFCLISIIIILISFLQKKSPSKIRKNYIHHHRFILCLLVFLWIAPIWTNLLIYEDDTNSQLFDILNKLAFFCIVSSSGVINIVRMVFDKFLRQKILQMICLRAKKATQSMLEESNDELKARKKEAQDEIWNLPLSKAMNEFQSQQIVHNIIQVVCQACSAHTQKNSHLLQSHVLDESSHSSITQSIYKSSVIVESEIESAQNSIVRLFHRRQELKYENMNPNNGTLQDLKQLCRKKRVFNMVCINSIPTNEPICSLGRKTVHIRSNFMQSENIPEDAIKLLLNIKVTSYSHRVFQALREYDNLSAQNIIETLDLQKNINSIKRAKESLGASGSFFFFSYDHKIVIKTISEQEKDRFIEILPYYFDHIRYNQNSLLARTYGIFSIEIAGISKIYFIMMENTFKVLEQQEIQYQIYDLKGSTVQRQVKDPQATVFKDINYFKSSDCFIYMSKQNKLRLIDQITNDIDMLKKHNIMDYSLLLGVGKSKSYIRKRNLYDKGGICERRVQNFRYITELQEITKKVYSISLIDYLQEFNFNKKLELWLKKVFKGGGDISSIGTELYYQRFLSFLNRIIIVFNIKFEKKLLISHTA